MGLAANQARLLTLQSRMHDLELTSMRCTNEKILLTAMSNNIAIKYNDMLTEANNIGPDYITTTNTTNGSRTYNTANFEFPIRYYKPDEELDECDDDDSGMATK